MIQLQNFYVYAYLRDRDSEHGKAGTPYYIGKGKGARMRCKQRNFPKPTNPQNIVMLSSDIHEADAFQAEMLLIALYGRLDKGTGCLYNLTDGGEGISGFHHSDKSRRMVWENRSEESRQLLLRGSAGRTVTPEIRKRLSDAQKGKKMSPASNEKKRLAMLGRKQTAEHKRKRIESRQKGAGWKPATAETRRKISIGGKGKRHNRKLRMMVAPISQENLFW